VTLRLHIGSGTIYCRDYVNVDVVSPRTFLASERPDLVERYVVESDDYYARHREHARLEAFRDGPREDPYVCDRFGSWESIPCRDGEAIEVLSRQVVEHLAPHEMHAAMREARRVLSLGGILRLSVPDWDTSFRAYHETGDEALLRHILGPRNGERGYHLVGYRHASLRAIVESHGFTFMRDETNIHAYPALCCAWERTP
jgi:hypothetical protein